MDEQILSEIGLSINESKIYVALLELGLSTITEISKRCNIHRTNVYDSINKLVEKGLVSYIQKDKVTFYEGNNPRYLHNIIKEKERKLLSILPQLDLKRKLATAKGEAHILEGISALMQIFYGLLQYKDTILAYGIPKLAPKMLSTKLPHFHKERIKLKIPMKHIYNHNAKDRINFLNKMKHTSAKYLPEVFDSNVATIVCGEEVSITVWADKIMTIRIKNKTVADSYKAYFSLLWESSR